MFAGARRGRGGDYSYASDRPRGSYSLFSGARKRDKTAFRLDEGTAQQAVKNVGGAVKLLKLVGIL